MFWKQQKDWDLPGLISPLLWVWGLSVFQAGQSPSCQSCFYVAMTAPSSGPSAQTSTRLLSMTHTPHHSSRRPLCTKNIVSWGWVVSWETTKIEASRLQSWWLLRIVLQWSVKHLSWAGQLFARHYTSLPSDRFRPVQHTTQNGVHNLADISHSVTSVTYVFYSYMCHCIWLC